MPTRREMWERLGEDVDVLVVGGGITGSGIARDAVRRGLKVALVEMNDLAYGTSSRSSKLVHGGLRYLEHYEFSMVFESVSERKTLMDLAPHLVNPLGFVFPVYKGARQSLFMVNAGMWLYDGLALFRSPKRHRKLSPKEVEELEPALLTKDLKGAPLYYDCSTDDARLTLETALDAAKHGATICTFAKVQRFVKDEHGRVCGAKVVDTLGDGGQRTIQAKVVINATGPWTDALRKLSPTPGHEQRDVLRPTKGVHIVVDAAKLPLNHAVVCFHPTDERVLFALPWGDRTYVGTTDTDYEGDPADVAATREDVDYLIDAANSYFPDDPIAADDVIATWAGLRPLVAPLDSNVSESQVSREHEILVGRDGLLTIAGGKLTTYRKMAGEVVDEAVKLLRLSRQVTGRLRSARTDEDPLPGGIGWPDDDDHEAVAKRVREASGETLPEDVARYLADTYGMRALTFATEVRTDEKLRERLVPGRPEILGVVDWAVKEELATTVCDVLIRRTQLFYRDEDQGLGCADMVATRMGELLGWSSDERKRHLAAYRDEVGLSRRWREV